MSNPLHRPELVRRVITAAVLAPSVHNTQPWRFVLRDGVLELHADGRRRLPVMDPRGRAMVVSCGAALLNVRLALASAGATPEVTLVAGGEHGDGMLLAEVRAAEPAFVSSGESSLYAAIARRRSNRQPFQERQVPDDVVKQMIAAAESENAQLWQIERDVASAVLEVVRDAEKELVSDPEYRSELDRWTADRHRLDGVPRYAFGPRPGPGELPMRDFGLDWWHSPRPGARFERRPQLAALVAHGDDPRSWLAAGQALQRVLLTATAHGVATSLFSQPVDVKDMRRPRPGQRTGSHLQIIIRFGYGPPAPSAPRRPVTAVFETA
ncbi:Acg family FMN-binding oxidoreductase [Spirillospora sp. NPDC048911]|uniref:Acg family FMN-binding oxidoreductase n=1 Tax=Spirillospora sp. NPDC048911 TaxID=3364527 RepID=UPI003721E290